MNLDWNFTVMIPQYPCQLSRQSSPENCTPPTGLGMRLTRTFDLATIIISTDGKQRDVRVFFLIVCHGLTHTSSSTGDSRFSLATVLRLDHTASVCSLTTVLEQQQKFEQLPEVNNKYIPLMRWIDSKQQKRYVSESSSLHTHHDCFLSSRLSSRPIIEINKKLK